MRRCTQLSAKQKISTFVFLRVVVIAVTLLEISTSAKCQEQFELTTSGLAEVSVAEVTSLELAIHDSVGKVTRYARERRFDTSDGSWVGYYSPQARQAIRWPSSGSGRMQIGTVGSNGATVFRESQMSVRAAGRAVPRERMSDRAGPLDGNLSRSAPSVPETERTPSYQPVSIQLINSQNNVSRYLGRQTNGIPGVLSQPTSGRVDWQMVPVGQGLIRLQIRQGTQWLALGCQPNSQIIGLLPISGQAGQLWRLNAFPGGNRQFALENLLFPGQALTWQNSGLVLQALTYGAGQQWSPFIQPAIGIDPYLRTVSHQIVPNPPLPPAQVELLNRHRETIWIIVADRRPGGPVTRYRIPAGGRELVSLERDTGATIVENYEVQLVAGVWDRQQYSTPVPPATLYDISVHEEFLQSIAIDRTGKSPNSIEDINFQPRSIGWFLIPPGDRLPDRAELDCYNQAVAADNPGAVRRLDPKLFEKASSAVDPLKQLLDEIQSRRGKF